MKYLTTIFLLSIMNSAVATSFADCYKISESTLAQRCAYDKVEYIKNVYEKERMHFIKNINEIFDENSKEVRNYEEQANAKWLDFIEYQCKIEASAVADIDSYGYNIQYGSCMFNFYKERIEFFHKISK